MTRTSGEGGRGADQAFADAAGDRAPDPTGGPPASAPTRPGRLHQPWRALVALAELILAATAGWLAVRLWQSGITVVPTPDGSVELTHYHGDAISGAIGLGLVGVLLVLDAGRQLLLAVRVRSRRGRSERTEPWPPFDEDV
ncbi:MULTISPECIES: hypothetical protein [Thermocrispum]|jgi:hypothetical protein|uniref:hypothetical protein n=1 Tax=Thermocrispum TaxID=37924 RepID=UPI001FDFC7E6|nr:MULTISPECIES: hypothetical protein [Thermocrispum]